MTREARGMWLGLLGAAAFSLTLPATRVAAASPSPLYVGMGRVVVAALPSTLYLLPSRPGWPRRTEFSALVVVALGGIARVGQVQLLQPFLTLIAAVILLGEAVNPTALAFALLGGVTVAIGRHMPVLRA